MTTCPCNSQLEFDQCCGPLLAGEVQAPTAEALMRSRYSAYTRKDYEYLIRTCHPSDRPTQEDFEDQTELTWKGLQIVSSDGGGPEDEKGMVEFIAHYQGSGMDHSWHERSSFVKEFDKWFYLDGEVVKPQPARSEKIGRNEPCPCGSGRKFKKCCLGKENKEAA